MSFNREDRATMPGKIADGFMLHICRRGQNLTPLGCLKFASGFDSRHFGYEISRCIFVIAALVAISGCRLGNDGDDADSPSMASLDNQAQDSQVEGSVVPEAATGILMAMGMGALWATNRGWRF